MAEDKKSFILYCDQIHLFENLDDDEAGRLIKHIYRYVNDMNPELTEKILKIAFEPIKLQLKRDLVKYEESKEDKASNGALGNLKRWHSDLYNSVIENKITLKEAVSIAKHRKASHSDNSSSHRVAKVAVTDTVNDTVNDTVTDINKKSDFYIFRESEFENLNRETYEKITKEYKITKPMIYTHKTKFPLQEYDLVEHLAGAIEDDEWKSDLITRFGEDRNYLKAMVDYVNLLKTNFEYMTFSSKYDFMKYYSNWLNLNIDNYKK